MEATSAWKTGLLLIICTLMKAANTPAVHIQIVVYDGAVLRPQTLSYAEEITGKILLASGLETEWSAGPNSDVGQLGKDFSARAPSECASQPVPSPVRVQVIARAPASVSVQTLGFSLPCAEKGIQVVIFADHVARASETALPTFRRVLGYVLAHELGHVLLQSGGHEDSGLMKAVWSKRDWQRAAVSIIPFSPEQTQRIIEGLRNTRNAGMIQWASIHNDHK